jgi:hypothetical protein
MDLLRKLGRLLGMLPSTGTIEPRIVRDAQKAAEWAAEALWQKGYNTDFSLESLKELDRFFDEQAPNGTPRPDGLLTDHLGARIFAIGSYMGEVIRRQCGGEWQGNDEDPQAEINLAVVCKDGGVNWPVQRVMKRFENGPEDGLYIHGRLIVQPPEDEEDEA